MTRSELGRIGPHLVALVHERPGGVATTVWDSMKMGELRSMVRVGGTPTFMLKLRLDLTPAWAAPSCFLVLESSRENNQLGKRKRAGASPGRFDSCSYCNTPLSFVLAAPEVSNTVFYQCFISPLSVPRPRLLPCPN